MSKQRDEAAYLQWKETTWNCRDREGSVTTNIRDVFQAGWDARDERMHALEGLLERAMPMIQEIVDCAGFSEDRLKGVPGAQLLADYAKLMESK